jgi:hypothetical protein
MDALPAAAVAAVDTPAELAVLCPLGDEPQADAPPSKRSRGAVFLSAIGTRLSPVMLRQVRRYGQHPREGRERAPRAT